VGGFGGEECDTVPCCYEVTVGYDLEASPGWTRQGWGIKCGQFGLERSSGWEWRFRGGHEFRGGYLRASLWRKMPHDLPPQIDDALVETALDVWVRDRCGVARADGSTEAR